MACTEIVVFGSANIDLVCYTNRLPNSGETIQGTKFQIGFGGKGANQCVAATRLGANCVLVAKLGDDRFGNDYMTHLCEENVNVEYVTQVTGKDTGIAQVTVAADGANNIVIVAGANSCLTTCDVVCAQMVLATAKVLVCQLETPVEATIAALQQFCGISIVNAAPAIKNPPPELLRLASIFCVNEIEAAQTLAIKQFYSVEDAKKAVTSLINMGGNTVIITMGELGAVFGTREFPNEITHVPSPKVDAVDTTGAGDAFIGALAFYLVRCPDQPMEEQIKLACQVASQAVMLPGAQTSFPRAQ